MQKDILLVSGQPHLKIKIRKMLKNLEEQFFLLGIADNGVEGIEKAQLLNADIIILYMWAGLIDGEDFVRMLEEKGCMSKVLILIDSSEKQPVFHRKGLLCVSEESLTSAKQLERYLRELNQMESETTKQITNSLYHSIMECHSMMDVAIVNDRYKLNIHSEGYCYIVFFRIIRPDFDAERYIDENISDLKKLLDEDNGGAVFCTGQIVCVLINDTVDAVDLMIKIRNSIVCDGAPVHFYVCERTIGLENIQKRLADVENRIRLCFFSNGRRILYERDVKKKGDNKENLQIAKTAIREIQYDITEMDMIGISEDIHELMLGIVCESMDYFLYEYVCQSLESIFYQMRIIYSADNPGIAFPDLPKAGTINVAAEMLAECFALLVGIACKNIKNTPAVRNAVHYIRKHYKTISVTDICDKLGMSASYFSRIFKEKTGVNYMDYLKNIRIRHAKELLAEGQYKIYEIAERTGFPNVKYFSSQFREMTGLTPREYMKLSSGRLVGETEMGHGRGVRQ